MSFLIRSLIFFTYISPNGKKYFSFLSRTYVAPDIHPPLLKQRWIGVTLLEWYFEPPPCEGCARIALRLWGDEE